MKVIEDFFSASAIAMSFDKFETDVKKKHVVWACKILRTAPVSCALKTNIPRNLK